jgi:hypothetical protein
MRIALLVAGIGDALMESLVLVLSRSGYDLTSNVAVSGFPRITHEVELSCSIASLTSWHLPVRESMKTPKTMRPRPLVKGVSVSYGVRPLLTRRAPRGNIALIRQEKRAGRVSQYKRKRNGSR